MTLESVRKTWEYGLTVKAVVVQVASFLVVLLNDQNGKYTCNRYFETANHYWMVSVDVKDVNVEVVWMWLNNPRALQESDYDAIND